MMCDLMKLQKRTTATEGTRGHPEKDIIPLNSYAITEGYEQYPQSARNPYGQRDTLHSTTQRPKYPNRRSYEPPVTTYDERKRESYTPFFNCRHLGTRHAGPPSPSTFYERAQQPIEDTSFAQTPGGYGTSRAYEGTSTAQPIIGPDSIFYYLAYPLFCFHCQEEGHLRPQCPRLHNPGLSRVTLGPEHPDTSVRPRAESLVRTADRIANMIEIAKE